MISLAKPTPLRTLDALEKKIARYDRMKADLAYYERELAREVGVYGKTQGIFGMRIDNLRATIRRMKSEGPATSVGEEASTPQGRNPNRLRSR